MASFSSEQVNILQCNYCRRRIGLWNYKHINETNGTSKDHNGTEMNQNGTESGPSDEETEEPCRKRVKLVRNVLYIIVVNVLNLFAFFCPQIKCGLPGLEFTKCLPE